MKWTNKFSLPESLASAIRNDTYEKVGDISVTGLLRPPQMRVLEKAHDHEITVDVSESVWSLLGQSVHSVIERADNRNALAEERMVVEVLGWKVSGKPDLLGEDMVLDDFKVTSVFAFLLGDKPEWEQQLNIYRWLYKQVAGFDVKRLRIIAILRDWVSARAGQGDYPKCGIMVVDIPMWDLKAVEEFVKDKVVLHQRADKMKHDELPRCTPSEMWERASTWAVKKPGNKTAYRVCHNPNEAAAIAKFNGMIVETRPGERVRCARFCHAAPWCHQEKCAAAGK